MNVDIEPDTSSSEHSISTYYDNEEEFSSDLTQIPGVFYESRMNEIGLRLDNFRTEVQNRFGYADIVANVAWDHSTEVVIETQKGKLDDNHIIRGQKYARDIGAEILIFIADDISQENIWYLGEVNDDVGFYILGAEVHLTEDSSVKLSLDAVISPADWEAYLDEIKPSGIDLYRFRIFEELEERLSEEKLLDLNRRRKVPKHSGYSSKNQDVFDNTERSKLYLSVKDHSRKEDFYGDKIGRLQLRYVFLHEEPEKALEEFIGVNNETLDEYLGTWHPEVNRRSPQTESRYRITVSCDDIYPDNTEQVVEWYIERIRDMRKIEDEIQIIRSDT